jgi:hypothetical protein
VRARDLVTHTPIKHVIIIIGENRTFDNVFATYVPKSGETPICLTSVGETFGRDCSAGLAAFRLSKIVRTSCCRSCTASG